MSGRYCVLGARFIAGLGGGAGSAMMAYIGDITTEQVFAVYRVDLKQSLNITVLFSPLAGDDFPGCLGSLICHGHGHGCSAGGTPGGTSP